MRQVRHSYTLCGEHAALYREMSVPLGHRSGLVTEDLIDRPERYYGHGHVGGGCMTEVVELTCPPLLDQLDEGILV